MKILFSIISLVFLITGLYAQDAQKWLDRINEKYANVETFSADFKQKNTWDELDAMKVSRGTLYFTDQKFCMVYSIPEGQFLLIDADSMLVFDAASNQAIITFPDTGDTGIRPDRILSYYAGDNADITGVERSEFEYFIRIVPADIRDIKRIEATVNIEKLVIESISYTDVENNKVKYDFDNIQFDQPIDENIFHFEVPYNATLIDQRL